MSLAAQLLSNPFSLIFAASLGFLLAAVLLAVRMIRGLGVRGGWWVLGLTLVLSAVQRLVVALGSVCDGLHMARTCSADLIGLFSSIALFVAMYAVECLLVAREREERRSRLIVEAVPDAIVVVGADGEVQEANPAFRSLVGWGDGEPLQCRFEHCAAPGAEGAAEKLVADAVAAGWATGELRLRDGEGRLVVVDAAAVRASGGGEVFLVLREVTAQREAEAALAEIAALAAGGSGEEFFGVLAAQTAHLAQVRHVLLGEVVDGEPPQLRARAVWADDRLGAPADYPLAGTPWADAVVENVVVVAEGARERYPAAALFRELGAEAVIGVAWGAAGRRPSGLLLALADRPLAGREVQRSILAIIAARAAAECERLRVEEHVREMEARLRACIEHAPNVAVQWFDREARVVFWNRASERMFGWTAAEAEGRRAEQLAFSAGGGDAFRAILRGLGREGAPRGPVETVYRRRDGAEVICLSTVFPLPGGSRETVYVNMDVDITESRRAELAARASERRFRDLFERSPDPILVQDFSGVILDCNAAACRMQGALREQVVGKRWGELVPAEYRGEVARMLPRLISGEINTFEGLGRKADGGPTPVEVRVSHIEHGGRPALLLHVRDIARRKRAEAELRESEARFRFLVEGIPQVFWLAEVAPERLVYVSPAVEEVFGTTAERVKANPRALVDQVHPEDRAKLAAAAAAWVAGRADEMDVECRFLHPEESIRWVRLRGLHREVVRDRPLRVSGIAEDITAAKIAAEERVKFERRLQETAKLESLGVLAGGIAHDFNNLLTGILGNASLGRMQLAPDSPLQGALGEIEMAAVRAADLCRQMLAYSGRGQMHPRLVDLSKLVEGTMQLLQFSIGKGVALRQALAPGLPAIMADATQLQQVVMNLAINASEAIGDSGGHIHLTTGIMRADPAYLAGTVSAPDLPPGDYLFIEVKDDGCGMTPENLARIFEPFFTTKFTGRGLGLSAVLGIVSSHRGAIKVFSQAGRGTTFTVLLPPAGGRVAASDERRTRGEEWRGQGVVLVVDDEEPVRMVAVKMLEEFGFTALTAEDGRVGVERYRANRAGIVAVLLDLTMPRMGGEEVLNELRQIEPELPVVIMSGFDETEAARRFAGKKVSGFLHKPFRVEEVGRLLQAALGG